MMGVQVFATMVLTSALLALPSLGDGFAEKLDAMKKPLLDKATHTVVYKKASGVELKLYVFVPENLREGERRPAIHFIHGGGWQKGDASHMVEHALYFCQRGMVTACCEYRLLKTGKGDKAVLDSPAACLTDVKSAMRYLRAHAGQFHIDVNAIVSAGGSAGGHLALALATLDGFDDPADDLSISCKPQAMLLFNPAYMWTARKADNAGMEKDSFAAARFVKKGIPPLVSFSGSEDGLSSPDKNHDLVDAVKSAGSDASYFEYAGRGHGFFKRARGNEDFKNVLFHCDRFLCRLGYLKGDPLVDDGAVAPEIYNGQTSRRKEIK